MYKLYEYRYPTDTEVTIMMYIAKNDIDILYTKLNDTAWVKSGGKLLLDNQYLFLINPLTESEVDELIFTDLI